MAKEMTKVERFNELINIVAVADVEDKDEIQAFLEKEIARLEAAAEKAKERRAEKAKAADVIKEQIVEIVNAAEGAMTAEAIMEQIGAEDITKAKVTARCSALVREGIFEKEDVKVEGRRLKAYRVA